MTPLTHHHLSVRKEFEEKFGNRGINSQYSEVGLEEFESFLSSSLASQLSEVEKVVEGKMVEAKDEDLFRLEGMRMTDNNIKKLVRVSCDLRQNAILSDLLLTLRKEGEIIKNEK